MPRLRGAHINVSLALDQALFAEIIATQTPVTTVKTIANIVEVALPIPKRRYFDYLLPEGMKLVAGCRVLAPFGPRKLVGIVIRLKQDSEFDPKKLKPLITCLDEQSVFPPPLLKLLSWSAQYYQHPHGDVLTTALPVNLRKGEAAQLKAFKQWQLTELGVNTPADNLSSQAQKQKQLLLKLQQAEDIQHKAFSPAIYKALEQKQLIQQVEKQPELDLSWADNINLSQVPTPNVEQALVISALQQQKHFQCNLLEGVTGSGKTEVYLQSIEPLLRQGKQVLILVPEIGLTPQTVSRFQQRFNLPVGILHSNLNDKQRLEVWLKAKQGALAIIIGTRSAIFTPLARPGMIIVDEEHDASFKQQDGFRYHARDLAAKRAHIEDIPLLLGSATPSLESLNNALSGKYRHFQLQQRAANATLPRYQLLDIKHQPLNFGLAMSMQQRIQQHLQGGDQVMLFLNRRGYSPAVICHDCGHVEQCLRCNKSYTLHQQLYKIQCHHCGSAKPIPKQCKECGSENINSLGVGTEQLEQGLQQLFPQANTVRIDSDSVRGKDKLHQLLDDINQNHYQLLLGTQILAKGHHFSNVTLVVIMDVDGALFSADFRAAEHLAQLITQVAGRSGRASKPGEVWLQTHHPEHPLLQDLINNGFQHFARMALQERQHACLPPYFYQALFKAEAHQGQKAFDFLCQISEQLRHQPIQQIGPLPALMEKRQGRYRMQLLLQSPQRAILQKALQQVLPHIENLPQANQLRWSLDVDPIDFS